MSEQAQAGAGTGADQGQQSTGQFDPEAFKNSLLSDIDKRFNGALKANKTEFSRMLDDRLKVLAPKSDQQAQNQDDQSVDDGSDQQKRKPADSSVDHRVKRLESQLAEERKAREESEKKQAETEARRLETERQSVLRQSLAGVEFANEYAADDAFRLLKDTVQRGEDGALYGPDEMPLKDYVAGMLKTRTHWLKALDKGGANAEPSNRGPNKPLDLNTIRPGMDKAQLMEASRQVGQTLAAMNRR